jgi:uncharacterized protein YbaR (Trm112 family)/SAM-dependent methyltransferase
MQPDLLSMLQCPACEGALELHIFRASQPARDGIEEGLLICRECSCPYPVTEGIPRLLPNSFRQQRQFVREFSRELSNLSYRKIDQNRITAFEQLHGLTARAFGYEWNTYKTTSREEDIVTFFWLTGADPQVYKRLSLIDVFTYYPSADEIASIDPSRIIGKRILDVGCGMGKYLKVVSEYAREVVGMDLSDAVSRARRELRKFPNVQLVQGDILNPPFKRYSMDFVYSVGVLHHTPDCHQSFLRCASLVTPRGHLAVWLYPVDPTPGRYARWVHWLQDDLLRPITCRVPHSVLRMLSGGLGRLTFVRDRYAERYRATGSRWAYQVAMAAGAVAVGRHKDPEIAAFLNFDWYSPQYRSYHTEEELQGWYKEAGFADVSILPQRVSGIGRAERLCVESRSVCIEQQDDTRYN